VGILQNKGSSRVVLIWITALVQRNFDSLPPYPTADFSSSHPVPTSPAVNLKRRPGISKRQNPPWGNGYPPLIVITPGPSASGLQCLLNSQRLTHLITEAVLTISKGRNQPGQSNALGVINIKGSPCITNGFVGLADQYPMYKNVAKGSMGASVAGFGGGGLVGLIGSLFGQSGGISASTVMVPADAAAALAPRPTAKAPTPVAPRPTPKAPTPVAPRPTKATPAPAPSIQMPPLPERPPWEQEAPKITNVPLKNPGTEQVVTVTVYSEYKPDVVTVTVHLDEPQGPSAVGLRPSFTSKAAPPPQVPAAPTWSARPPYSSTAGGY